MKNVATLLNEVFDIMDKEFMDPYIVMNKYDEVPYKLPSDLDMSVTPRDFRRLDVILTSISKGVGLAIIQKIWHGYQKCAYILSPLEFQGRFRLQLDFFTDFSVKNAPLLISYQDMQTEIRSYSRFTIPNYRMEYVFLLMRRIFKNDFDTEHTRVICDTLMHDKDECVRYLSCYLGNETSQTVSQLVRDCNVKALQELRSSLWSKLQSLSRRKSRGSYKLNFRLEELKRYWYRIKYPVGFSVVLLSPDGGGKSSVFEKLNDTCWGSFHGITKMYFRPHILPNPGMLNPLNPIPESSDNPDPHGKKSNGLFKSLLRYFYYNIDFILGYNIIVLKKLIQKQLVIFDRYYYDYFVDIRRYRYSFPSWIPKVFAWSIPRPDVIFILEGTPEVLFNRKKELSVEEISRQIKEYRKIAGMYDNAVIIDVNKPLDNVTLQITREILQRKAQQTAMVMKNKLNVNGIPE